MEENKKKKDIQKAQVEDQPTAINAEAESQSEQTENKTDDMVTDKEKQSGAEIFTKDSDREESSHNTEEEGRYKKILDLEENLWTYGSPILIESGVLERDQVSRKNRLTLKFTNIYYEEIRNLSITVFSSDEEGNTEQIEHTYAALGQKYLSTKGRAAKITIHNENADKFVIRVDRVDFENGRTGEKEDAVYESIGPIEDIENFAETKLKDYDGSYTSGVEEVSKDDAASVGNGIEILQRIHWYKDASEILRDAKRKYEIVKQNEERRQASESRKEKRQKAVKKRYIMGVIAVAVAALIVVAAVLAFFIPNGKYKEAKKILENKKYEEAVKAFDQLNGFLKSEEYLAEAYYNLGLMALENKDEKKASEYFKKGTDADENSKHGQMSDSFLDYYAGMEALEKNDYEQAMKLFQASEDAATDINLINKASAGMAKIYHTQQNYEKAWNTIKNVFAKDESYHAEYGTYGYSYAKSLVDSGKVKEGMEIYNTVSKYTKSENLNKSVYDQAIKLGEQGKISEAMKLLSDIKKNYNKANKLYEKMYKFNDKVQYWLGLWKHHGKVKGKKKTYRIYISQVLYQGDMCLKIKDKNNDYPGDETVISPKNRVTQIQIGTYQLHFKLKKFHDQKFTFTLKGGKKMIRQLKYGGETYKTKYKKKVK